ASKSIGPPASDGSNFASRRPSLAALTPAASIIHSTLARKKSPRIGVVDARSVRVSPPGAHCPGIESGTGWSAVVPQQAGGHVEQSASHSARRIVRVLLYGRGHRPPKRPF